jgi:hypothetical protein
MFREVMRDVGDGVVRLQHLYKLVLRPEVSIYYMMMIVEDGR